MGIQGKRIIVTGGASGMGNAAVRRFADEGARVASIDLSEQTPYRDVILLKGNVSDRESISHAIAEAAEKLGGLDAIFNIAGVNRFGAVEDTTAETMDLILSVNVKGLMFCCQAAFPFLKEHGGVIVNFGSQAADNAGPDSAIYSASKAAVASITRKIAWEWGQYGIRANTIEPSAWTPLFEKTVLKGQAVTPELKAQVQAGMKNAFPLGYLGDPYDDIAPVLVFLASDASRYMTGQCVAVNGGSAMVR